MKKLLILFVLLWLPTFCHAADYLRPTTDIDVPYGYSAPCTDSDGYTSESLSGTYTGKSGPGPITVPSYGSQLISSIYVGPHKFVELEEARIFKFTGTYRAYSSLTLNLSVQNSLTGVSSSADAYYSTNNGSTWTHLGNFNNLNTIFTVPINGISPTNVQILVCSLADSGITRHSNTYVYDLWITGISNQTIWFTTQ